MRDLIFSESRIVLMVLSLKNHGADAEVDRVFEATAEMMALPLEEKMKFIRGDGIKAYG